MVQKGRQTRGGLHPLAKLNDDAVREIRISSEKGVVLARKFNVSQAVISRVRNHGQWRHIQ